MSAPQDAARGSTGSARNSRAVAVLLGDTMAPAWLLPALALGIWLTGAWLLLGAGASYSSVWLNDQLGLVDAGYRMAAGQVPSLDFRSIYGAFTYLPLAAALDAGISPGLVLPVAHATVSGVLVLLATFAVRRRLGLAAALLVLVAACTLAQAPVVMGKSPLLAMSFGVYYNRHGWALLAVVLLYFVDPPRPGRRDVLVDAAVLGTLLSLLLYGIFNYGVIALAFVCANAVTSRHKLRAALGALMLLLACALVLEWLMPGYHAAYLSQLFPRTGVASQAAPGVNRIAGALLREGMAEAALLAVALATVVLARGWRWVTVFYAAGTLAACVVLSTQTGSGTVGMPALAGVLAALAELTRRAVHSTAINGLPEHLPPPSGNALPVLALGILVAALAQPVAANVEALVLHHLNARQLAPWQAALRPPPALATFRVGPLRPDPFAAALGVEGEGGATRARIRRALHWPLPTSVYYETVVDGAQLLQRHAPADARVVVFDKVDPFSAALGLPSTCRGVPLFWTNRIRDPARMPSEREFIADADIAMIPLSPYDQFQIDNLMRRYGPYLRQHFVPAQASRHWQLWERRGPRLRACPRDGMADRAAAH